MLLQVLVALSCTQVFAAGKTFRGTFKKVDGPQACADKLSAKVENQKLAVEEIGGKKIGVSGVCGTSLTKDSNSQFGIEENPKGTLSVAKLTIETSCPGSRERTIYTLNVGSPAELVYDVEGALEPLHCAYAEVKK